MCLVLGVQLKAEGRKPFGSALNAPAPDDADRTASRCPTGGLAPYRFYVAGPSFLAQRRNSQLRNCETYNNVLIGQNVRINIGLGSCFYRVKHRRKHNRALLGLKLAPNRG